MMREAEWARDKSTTTIDDYMSSARISSASGVIVLIALYFLGFELSEEIVRSSEYNNLFKHLSTCGRLLNDVQSFKREREEGKLNSVTLYMTHGSNATTEDEAVREMKRVIDRSKRELLRLVLLTEGSVVPRACKQLFWKASRVFHIFYMKNDGFSSQQEMVNAVDAVIHDTLNLPSSSP